MAESPSPRVSIAFISYRRPDLLSRSLEALRSALSSGHVEYIVCDDGSPKEMQDRIGALPADSFVLARENRGLGANQNAAVAHSRGDFILQVQDDWVFKGPKDFLDSVLEVMEEFPDIAFVRLWHNAGLRRAHETRISKKGLTVRVFLPAPLDSIEESQYLYSDRPHLKRREFHKAVGSYREDLRMIAMETEFARRCESMPALRFAVIEGYEDLFDHCGIEVSHNPTQRRENLRQTLAKNPITGWAWRCYVRLRYGRDWDRDYK
ncbi:MAG: glycosyltransferase [Acidobacteriota bacterium]